MTRITLSRHWRIITRELRERSHGRCECRGECQSGHQTRCEAVHGRRWGGSDWPIVLSTVHVARGCSADQQRRGCTQIEHVVAMCQDCHKAYERAQAARSVRG